MTKKFLISEKTVFGNYDVREDFINSKNVTLIFNDGKFFFTTIQNELNIQINKGPGYKTTIIILNNNNKLLMDVLSKKKWQTRRSLQRKNQHTKEMRLCRLEKQSKREWKYFRNIL